MIRRHDSRSGSAAMPRQPFQPQTAPIQVAIQSGVLPLLECFGGTGL